jgi:hypothetical protein
MKSDKKLENPAQNFKLRKKFSGSLPKEDLSDVVNIEPTKHKPITFTLRLSEEEQQDLQSMVAEINRYSRYKKISANDVIRALICSGRKMNPERVFKFIKEL